MDHLILTGNKDNDKSLHEFEFRPDPTTDYGVAALEHLKSMYIVVATLAPSFWIGSSSFLQIKRTCTKAGMSLSFRQIRQLTSELAALKRLKSQCLYFLSVSIDRVLLKLADTSNEEMHNNLDEFEYRPDWTTVNRAVVSI